MPSIYLGNPAHVERVLEVTKSQLCWVVGTVYMDMPLKPNVLEDIARDVSALFSPFIISPFIISTHSTCMTIQHSIPAPPPPKKFFSEEDSVLLEDESGRIRLVGKQVTNTRLVTGVIVAVLGVETPNGEFEVVDLCAAGLAPQTRSKEEKEKRCEKMDVDGESLRCFHLSL